MIASKPLSAAERMQKMRSRRKSEGRCPECGQKRRKKADRILSHKPKQPQQ